MPAPIPAVTTMSNQSASERPIYIARFRALPDVDPTHALRHMLEGALRLHGLQCLSCEEEHHATTQTSSSDHS
jgi:hypothetical protein